MSAARRYRTPLSTWGTRFSVAGDTPGTVDETPFAGAVRVVLARWPKARKWSPNDVDDALGYVLLEVVEALADPDGPRDLLGGWPPAEGEAADFDDREAGQGKPISHWATAFAATVTDRAGADYVDSRRRRKSDLVSPAVTGPKAKPYADDPMWGDRDGTEHRSPGTCPIEAAADYAPDEDALIDAIDLRAAWGQAGDLTEFFLPIVQIDLLESIVRELSRSEWTT